MTSTKEKSEMLCFKIHGEDLTRLARSLWADELQTAKAVRLLATGLQGFTEAMAIEVLTGKKKLVGCNSLDLVDDDATESACGNALSFDAVMSRVEGKGAEQTLELQVERQMRSGMVHVTGSPWGLIEVPLCIWKRIREQGLGWDDAKPYCRVIGDYYPGKGEPGRERMLQSLKEDREALNENARNPTVEIGGNLYWTAEVARARGMPVEDILQNDPMRHLNPVLKGTGDALLDQFIESDKAMRKAEKEGPKPDKNLDSENGWIAPSGDFFPCGPIQHDRLADLLDPKNGVKAIEKTHVRISVNALSSFREEIIFVGRKLTKAQENTIWDWSQKHGRKCPDWVFKNEGEAR